MMNKKNLPHIISVVLLVVFIVLALASATTPSAQIELSENYRKHLLQPAGNERAFDSVGVRGSTSFVCRDPQHNVTANQVLGAAYQLGGGIVLSGSETAQSTDTPSERHRHEIVIDQLLNEAKRQYPSEVVDIRNARTVGHFPTNERQEQYAENVRNSSGAVTTVQRTRSVWDCYPSYAAIVITTEPMPQPVTHSENFTKPGATRADMNRLALNWLEDNATRRRIRIDSQDFDRGRIRGTVTLAARADNTYIVTSEYTIDVMDARVEIRFAEAVLQRTDPELQRAGNPEPIFLQSIADATLAEIVDFSTTLRSYILSR